MGIKRRQRKRHGRFLLKILTAAIILLGMGIWVIYALESDEAGNENETAANKVTVSAAESGGDDFDRLRAKWKTMLTGGDDYDQTSEPVRNYIRKLTNSVTNPSGTGVWDTMRPGDPAGLWKDLQSTSPRAMTEQFNRLRTMALAYTVQASPLYGNKELRNDIETGLRRLQTNRFYANAEMSGNWWEWEIGTPMALKDILVLMADELPDALVQQYLKALAYVVPNPAKRTVSGVDETGANLADKALIVAVSGVLAKDAERIEAAVTSLAPLFHYSVKGDGFYRDGSFIQHLNIPYVGSYGVVLLESLSQLLYWLDGSPWSAEKSLPIDQIGEWYRDSYEPLMFEGAVLEMVRGRAISRQGSDGHTVGRKVMISFLRMADLLPGEQAKEIRRQLKYAYEVDAAFSDPYMGLGIHDIALVQQLMNDSGIEPKKGSVGHRQYPYMDRIVHRREDYAFGLSMYSSRIANYETLNGENIKGWYTGSGMTYLYNSDWRQYSDGYWPTVDPLRLPGTTTDGKPKEAHLGSKNWAGGVSLADEFGAAGMEFAYPDSGLIGRKAWFMLDDEIVALGTGITGRSSEPVQTIVENRKIRMDAGNRLLINGEEMPPELGWNKTIEGVRWAHLEGNEAGSDIGYVFPGSPTISAKRETRTGSWYSLNRTQSKNGVTRNYVSLWFDHGREPKGARYAYVLLPGKGAEETKAYSEKPDIEILSNTTELQAVREKGLGILAAILWRAGSIEYVQAKQKSAVMVREEGSELTFAASDPTQSQESLTFVLDRPGYRLKEGDMTVQVETGAAGVTITVDTSAMDGRSHEVVLIKDQPVAAASPVRFDDMKHHWAGDAVHKLADKKIVQGYPDNTFRPEEPVTRAQFAVMLANALSRKPSGGAAALPDMSGSDADHAGGASSDVLKAFVDRDRIPSWAASSVQLAVRAGWFVGYDDGGGSLRFDSDRILNRAETAVAAGRAWRWMHPKQAVDPDPLEYRDKAKIPEWGMRDIAMLAELGILAGYEDGTFRPDRPVTRAEAAVLIGRLIEKGL
jgi:hyaluronate lyase